jgi:hypothetical protein
MIAVCPNKECNQRYNIKPEMIGRIAKCKKCNNRFKVEELSYSPKPIELKPIDNHSIESKTKHSRPDGLEPKASPPSSETEPFQAPPTPSFKRKAHNVSCLLAIALFGIVTLLFIGNFHIITGSNKGLSIVGRNAFGFTEVFINADQIKGMPPATAIARFPLSFRILQKEGIIKSGEAPKRGIDDKEKIEIDQAVRNAQNEIYKMAREVQKELKK